MRRKKVESTTMYSVGYERKGGVLEVEFCSGAIYQYHHVPETVHDQLWNAESKGKYFNLHIRDQYSFQRVA